MGHCFWKCFGALEMPNGSLLKQYHPDGVMKVVRRRDSSERGICQNLLLASSFVKTLAPASGKCVVYFKQWVDFPKNTFVGGFEVDTNPNCA